MKGFVYLTEDDVTSAARFLKLPVAEFERLFVYRTRNLRRLRKPRGAQCHFLDTAHGCNIHPVKPVQCRLFPFWPELVEDRKTWERTAKFCPGIGKGDLVQIGAALEIASEMRTAYPTTY